MQRVRGRGEPHLAALSWGSDRPTSGIPWGAGMQRIPSCHACARGYRWTRPLNCHHADCGLVPSGMSGQNGHSSGSGSASPPLPMPSFSNTGVSVVDAGAAEVVYARLHQQHSFV